MEKRPLSARRRAPASEDKRNTASRSRIFKGYDARACTMKIAAASMRAGVRRCRAAVLRELEHIAGLASCCSSTKRAADLLIAGYS